MKKWEAKALATEVICGERVFFVAFFLLLSGLAVPALGAMGRDDFFALVENGDIAEIEVAIWEGQEVEQEESYGECSFLRHSKITYIEGHPAVVLYFGQIRL